MNRPAFSKIMVAVDDSPAALAAVRVAVELATLNGARLRFVHVIADGELSRARARLGRDRQTALERTAASDSLLQHVSGKARGVGLRVDSVSLSGDVAAVLLDAAHEWDADLVVLGRSDLGGAGRAYVGTVTRGVLEFSERPVLVVPRAG